MSPDVTKDVPQLSPQLGQVFHRRETVARPLSSGGWKCQPFWGHILIAFHPRGKKDLQHILEKDLVYLESNAYFLGQSSGQVVSTEMGIFLVMHNLVDNSVFSRGLGLAVPQNPLESRNSISPTEEVMVL